MSNEALTAIAKSEIRPSGRKFVAMALADYADEAWSCFPSVEQLAAYTCQGEKTVRDHLDALEADGVISRERHRREDGTLGRYRFRINRRNLPVADQRQKSPVADFARGEKQPEPAAKSATHNPQLEPSIISSAHKSAEFDRFWALYPNKVGKRAAEKSFVAARKRVEFDLLMSALVAYVNKSDDRAWCNPATWLNQDRWEDRPAQRPVDAQRYQTRPQTAAEILRNRRIQGNQTDDDRTAGTPRLVAIGHVS